MYILRHWMSIFDLDLTKVIIPVIFEGCFLQRFFILSSFQKKEMYNSEGNLLDE